jgi:hypothetical protein
MSDSKGGAVDGAYAMGIEMLDRGESPAAVEQKLIAMGLTQEAAKGIVTSYSGATAQAASSDGKTEMLFGALACAGGIVVLLTSGTGSFVGWLGTFGGAFNVYRGWSKRTS